MVVIAIMDGWYDMTGIGIWVGESMTGITITVTTISRANMK